MRLLRTPDERFAGLPDFPFEPRYTEVDGLRIHHVESLGRHYAETLRRWRSRFLDRKRDVRALGFDDRFLRRWDYYFAYCEAGFRAGAIDVAHYRIERV